MAARYWVGGTGTWDAATTTHWATSTGGAGGASVPTAADDVFLDANSTGTVTITGAVVCQSLDFGGAPATLTVTGTGTVTIGGAATGASGFAMRMVNNVTVAGTWSIVFVSTSATQLHVSGRAKTWGGSWSFTSGNYVLDIAVVCAAISFTGATGNLTFDSGSFAISCTGLTIGTGTKTLTFGSSTITGTNAFIINASGTTFTSNTSVLKTSSTVGATITGAVDLNGGSFQFTGATTAIVTDGGSGSLTCAAFTYTSGTSLTLGINVTCTGAWNVAGTGNTTRCLVSSSVGGTARTVTAASSTGAYVDYQDITGAGAASWSFAAITGLSGDCGGNSGITFTAPTTQAWSGTSGGNWSGNAWTTHVPLPQDTATLAVAFTAAQTVTFDIKRYGNVDLTGVTGSPVLAFAGLADLTFYGSLTFAAGMGTPTGPGLGSFKGHFCPTGAKTLTSAGKRFPCDLVMDPYGSGTRSLTLADDLTVAGHVDLGGGGTFNSAGKTITTPGTLKLTGTRTRSVTLDGSTINLTSATASVPSVIDATTTTGMTFSAVGTVVVLGASVFDRSMTVPGIAFGELRSIASNSPGQLTIVGAATWGKLNFAAGRGLTIPNGATQTVTGSTGRSTITGAAFGYQYFGSNQQSSTSAPDSGPLSITGDMEMMVRCALDDWTPTVDCHLLNKWAAGQASYDLFVQAVTGKLAFNWSSDGTATLSAVSSVAPTIADGAALWIAATIDVDNGVSGRDVKFWTSPDGVGIPGSGAWTQLGTTVTTATATSIFDSTTIVRFGRNGLAATGPSAKVWRCVIMTGFNHAGTIALDARFDTKPVGNQTFVEGSVNAATVTINGNDSLNGDGRFTLISSSAGNAGTITMLAGKISGDYIRMRDITATGGALFYAGNNSINISNNTGFRFTKAPAGRVLLPLRHP